MGLRRNFRNFVAQKQILGWPKSSRNDLIDVISQFQPVDTGHDLIRIGGSGDGGYLVPNDLEGIRHCFSPGVSLIADFEAELAEKYGIQSYMADASVEAPPSDNEHFHFEKKFLGAADGGEFITLQTWMNSQPQTHNDNDLLLQMDIEGAEYDVFITTPMDTLKRFRIIVVELHGVERIFDRNFLPLFRPLMQKLTSEFAVAHIHPNNAAPLSKMGGVHVPPLLEVTFLRKDRLIGDGAPIRTLPHPLDEKNVAHYKDVAIPRDWWSSQLR